PQLRFLERGKERHAGEAGDADDQPARGLRHGLKQHHPGHQRVAGEMAFEDRRLGRDDGFRSDGSPARVELQGAIDEMKVLKAPAGLKLHARLAATSWSMRAHKFCNTKY